MPGLFLDPVKGSLTAAHPLSGLKIRRGTGILAENRERRKAALFNFCQANIASSALFGALRKVGAFLIPFPLLWRRKSAGVAGGV